MQFASRDELEQWKDLLEKKLSTLQPTLEISHLEKKLEQLEKSEKKTGEQLKAEIKNSLGATEMLLDEKLGSVQTQLEAWLQNPLSGLETQIKHLTNQLSSMDQKVSQEIEKKLQTIHSMQFASRDELKQWQNLLRKKLSTSQPTLEISHLEKKLEQLEKSDAVRNRRNTNSNAPDPVPNLINANSSAPDPVPNPTNANSSTPDWMQILNFIVAGLTFITSAIILFNQCRRECRGHPRGLGDHEREPNTHENKQLKNEKDKLEKENVKLGLQNEQLKNEKDKLEKENVKLGLQNEQLKNEKDKLEKENVKLGLQNETLEKENEKLEKENENLRREYAWRKACCKRDVITLDAGTAHPNLSIAEDKKSFKHEAQPRQVPPNPQRFDSTVCVLGSEGFSSGEHYWEVDVGSSTDWDLGVARKSIQRKGKLSLSPKEGFWALGLSGKDYWAKTDPWTRVMVQKKPKIIGVYLNYQQREVTFFNVNDMSVMFTFNDLSVPVDLYPFFKNSQKETTMGICS
ncbi:girdin-like [Trachemys scripta elegans]|uniref:girdin-like n=1 Tax=Trachemys scripta elegans TaxID=31138 RepID=UPI001557A9DD|nr:girdin-like [Trachemys scripta elegans]